RPARPLQSQARARGLLAPGVSPMQPSQTTREPRSADKWTRWLPGLRMAQSYEIGWLRNDLVAGIVLSTMLIPVGMAYAVASGLPAINGLYATIVPLLAYAVFGPSRILVLGPDSSLAPMILAVVVALSAGHPAREIAIGAA